MRRASRWASRSAPSCSLKIRIVSSFASPSGPAPGDGGGGFPGIFIVGDSIPAVCGALRLAVAFHAT